MEKLENTLVENTKKKQTFAALWNYKNAQWQNFETHWLITRKKNKSLLHY
jgi:hypothetical protein